jgi:3-oxoacyl-[acyl-carrier protein] reductase
MLLDAKTSIITGASKGIGLSTLELFVKNGCKVVACYRENNEIFENKILNLKKEFPDKIFDVQFDLADKINTKQAALEIIKNHPEIDILVNNAGTIATSSFMMTPIEDIENMHKINFFNQMLFSQIILKKMIRKKNGSIVNIASSSAIDANEGRLAYVTSKASIMAATKLLAREMGHFNIRSNCVAPGLTNTVLMKDSTKDENIKKVTENLMIKRVAEPKEIANVIMFLASDLSSYITGQTIRVDGGMV